MRPPPPDPAARSVLGADAVARAMEAWLAEQLEGCTDRDAAARFAAACPSPGATVDDYLQRVVPTASGGALVGIRMRGGDVRHPFVDVLAWEGRLADAVHAGLDALAVFGTDTARVRLPGDRPPDLPGLEHEADQWVCAARLPPVRVPGILVPVDDVDEAQHFVDHAYRRWLEIRPWLEERVQPADRDALVACHRAGAAFWLAPHGARVGLLALEPGQLREWSGHVVIEEVVDPEHAGHGYAARGQRALGLALDGPIVVGTIDAANGPSVHTAARAGRPVVGGWWWVRRSGLRS